MSTKTPARANKGKGTPQKPTVHVATSPAAAAALSKNEGTGPSKFLGMIEVPPAVVLGLSSAFCVWLIWWAFTNSFRIRTYAIEDYGKVIHEFDPWFNFRATQYLEKFGLDKFFKWYDYMSWYPIGRPVGTTIFPGMQLASVAIYRLLEYFPAYSMSLNDVCVYVPCWFGTLASLLLGFFTWEVTSSRLAAAVSTAIMAVLPAHLMRSIGGGYDNESVAMSAMVLTFACWVRAVRNDRAWVWGVAAGLAYAFMIATWGGYVFVVNVIGVHAVICVAADWARGVWSPGLHRAYSLFYVIGVGLGSRVPVVGMTPVRSLEQIGPLIAFIYIQVLAVAEWQRSTVAEKREPTKPADETIPIRSAEGWRIRTRALGYFTSGAIVVAAVLFQLGYFGPLSSRVRGLFVRATRTGNPLVDSVAEHQPATADAYWHYLHVMCYSTVYGFIHLCFRCGDGFSVESFRQGERQRWRQVSFLLWQAAATYYFSLKMSRLVLLTAPVAASLSGALVGWLVEWSCRNGSWREGELARGTTIPGSRLTVSKLMSATSPQHVRQMFGAAYRSYRFQRAMLACLVLALVLPLLVVREWPSFLQHSENVARSLSHPQLMYKAYTNDGQMVMIDDYREAYFWLRDNTPKDARVMAWWDYGYQITGIAERTSIADGNTWNHEHIATLGVCLVSPVKKAHSLIRHLADYVLIWSGGGSDDLAKSPHMARIGNSVYRDVCPGDPTCRQFGFDSNTQPTPMMRKSLLYNLDGHNQRPGVHVDGQYFTEAYTTRYRKVRIFKVEDVDEESKAWVANSTNLVCDAPGSWFCRGQYPPAGPLQKLLAKRRDFGQMEDFNAKKRDDDYYREYMKRMGGG
eukprot:TRINITY_DN225_c0_g3_i1.p2 TRINITY_DN225_c0_g3~~TRINITY_DN225_c0_g3_i1.p2  ORF type:complete len:854 (+),score=220.19 TRINITY_DN225_c0_g3_i1:76-2637(+)